MRCLETDPQRKLNYAGSAIRSGLAEQGIRLRAGGWVELRRSVDRRPLRVIKGIVELAAKLEAGPVSYQNILECGEIPLILSGTAIHVPAGAPNVAERGKREHTLVKPLVSVSRTPGQVRIARDIDSLSVASSDQIHT